MNHWELICKCGKQYDKFMDLLRHVEANEFSYGCTFCKKIYTSHAHRLCYHQKYHPNQPRPNKDHNVTYAHDAASMTLHSTTDENQHLRRRQKSGRLVL